MSNIKRTIIYISEKLHHQYLVSEWHLTKNGKNTPFNTSYCSKKKVYWQCPKFAEHIYDMSPLNRYHGQNCPFCAGKRIDSTNSLATLYPQIAKLWHPSLNSKLTSEQVSTKSSKKVWWKCPVADDHIWKAVISNVTKSYDNGSLGCPFCHGTKVALSNCLATLQPDIASEWHIEKNGKLTPFDVTAKSSKKVWWQCDKESDHEWEASVQNRVIKRSKCPCCAGRLVVLSNCLATTNPELAAQWHPTKNGSITPFDIISGSNTKYWWQCSTAPDHEWLSSPNDRHNKGTQCPCCCNAKVVHSNCLATTHPELTKEWHPTKNHISPFNVTAGSKVKVFWLCSRNPHHEWEAQITNRANQKSNCPWCCISKGENSIAKALRKLNIMYIQQYRFDDCRFKRSLPFDFAVINNAKQIIGMIEYNGEQHYVYIDFFGGKKGLEKVKRNDRIKQQYCERNQIPLLIISFKEFDNINNVVEHFINKLEILPKDIFKDS